MSLSPSAQGSPFFLFGSTKPWIPPPWTTIDDRVRGGASQSYLTVLPNNNNNNNNSARFYGTLDYERLGGAGFASQFSPAPAPASARRDMSSSEAVVESTTTAAAAAAAATEWDLSPFDGVELVYDTPTAADAAVAGKGKVFTLILKDRGQEEELREDGRAKAGVNWEFDFRDGEGEKAIGVAEEEERRGEDSGGGNQSKKIWIPWQAFRATFRGKDVDDAGEFRKDAVWRVGIMMRSMFGQQKGGFSIELRSLSARKKEEKAVTKSEL